MPDLYDGQEAERLAEDAAAIVQEAWCEDGLVPRLLVEAELAGATAARDAFVRAIEERQAYHLTIAGLWAFMAEGVKAWDMAKVRGACAGLRTATMQELSRDPIAQTLNLWLEEEE